jgi:hypothetical protein
MLLVVVERFLCHECLLVRKKVLELLNKKMEDDYFTACEETKLQKLVGPLQEFCSKIGKSDVNVAEEVIQQLSLNGL